MRPDDTVIRRIERWFVRQGVPQLIHGYGFSRHVLPRMLPFLVVVVLASLALFVPAPMRAATLKEAMIVGGAWVLAVVGLGVSVALFRGRLPRFSRRSAIIILITYGLMPLILPTALVFAYGREQAGDLLRQPGQSTTTLIAEVTVVLASAFLVLFLLAWVVTAFALLPLTRMALRHMVGDMLGSLRLQGLALPTLLFVTLFLFFTGELWQIMDHLSWWRLGAVLALFAAITVLATATRLKEEIIRIEGDLHAERVISACAKTPLEPYVPRSVDPPGPLGRKQVTNILLVLATRQLVQAAVVGIGLFAFFVGLGVLMVDDATAALWIGSQPTYSIWVPGIPVALFRSAVLLAGFGSMYFAITAMTDPEYRQKLFALVIADVERTLTVRAVYLTVRAPQSEEDTQVLKAIRIPVSPQ